MSKKRKDVASQPGTLHDFFTTPGRGSAQKKPKLQNTQPKLKTPGSEKKARTKRPSLSAAAQEIIVIDSDEELPGPVCISLLEDSSDIEVVEDTVTHGRSEGKNPAKTVAKVSSHDNLTGDPKFSVECNQELWFGEPSTLLTQAQKQEESQEVSFGQAPLLGIDFSPDIETLVGESRSEIPETPRPEGQLKNEGRSSPNVVSAIFPSSDVSETDEVLSCPSPTAACTREVVTKPTSGVTPWAEDIIEVEQTLVPTNEDWGTGDDEIEIAGCTPVTPQKSLADDVDIDLTLDDDYQTCPICRTLLESMNALDIQEHVNACLDGPVTSLTKCPPKSLFSGASPSKSIVPPLQTPVSVAEPSKRPASLEEDGDTNSGSVFSALMNSFKENEAWKEASAAEDRNFRATKGNGGRRKAPFYKVLQGMPIAVDAFRYGAIPGITAYFLTHAHSDHYTNLSAKWANGPIYCSEGTANLIVHMLGVDRKWMHPLPMDVETEIPDTGGVRVTLIEANHCPGSCLFLFEGRQTVNAGDSAFKSPFVGSSKNFRYLHCGDFRASPQHVLHPAVKGKKIDHVYLDTTYLDPKYCFPPQTQVITACAEMAKKLVDGDSIVDSAVAKVAGKVDGWFKKPEKMKEKEPPKSGKTLVVVGTYSIGKERIVKAVAKALCTKVYSDARKTAILRCQMDPELHSLLTSNPLEAGVHLLPLGTIASDKLKIYLERWKGHFTKIIGFRPTGWTFSQPAGSDMVPTVSSIISRMQSRTFTQDNLFPMKNSTASLCVYGVPYSEHSSFFELTCFALSLDWGRMIATVNVGSEGSRGRMSKWVEKWEAERKKRGKVEVVQYRASDYW